MSTARRAFWRTVFGLAGGLRVTSALPPGGCVVVADHCSHADAPALVAALDAGHRPLVAAAADYWFDRPLRAFVCRVFVGGFPVRRSGGGYADLAAQRPALAAGRAVVVFPAGSRHPKDDRYRLGAFRLAAEADVPVVPVRLQGTARRGRVTVEIGTPVTVDDPAAVAQAIRDRLVSGQPLLFSPTQTDLMFMNSRMPSSVSSRP